MSCIAIYSLLHADISFKIKGSTPTRKTVIFPSTKGYWYFTHVVIKLFIKNYIEKTKYSIVPKPEVIRIS